MAWLEFTGGVFRIGFRFGGRKHHLPLKAPDRGEADAALGRFEANFRLVEQGVLEPPPDGVGRGGTVSLPADRAVTPGGGTRRSARMSG